MRKILSVITVLVFTQILNAQKVSVVSSDQNHLKINVRVSAADLIQDIKHEGVQYKLIKSANNHSLEIGKPDLPALGEWILIPNDGQFEIDIEKGEPEIVKDVMILPLQEPVIDNGEPKDFVIDKETYKTNKNYPGVFAKTESVKVKRGQSCTVLWIYPFQFNPVSKTLEVYKNLTITINFKGKGKSVAKGLKSKSYLKSMKSTAINADAILESQDYEENSIEVNTFTPLKSVSSTSTTVDCDFLIITHDDFSEYANKLASWRNRLGLRTYVVKTSEISSTYSTDNESTRRSAVETYINQAYNNWNTVPSYLLFMGDVNFIPTWYQTWHPYNSSCSNCQGYVGTDLYYADINSPADYVPEFAYARLPFNNPSTAEKFVSKLIQYETSKLSTSFYESALIAAQFQDNAIDSDGDGSHDTSPDGYEDRRFTKTAEDIRDYLVSESYNADRVYYYYVYPEYDNSPTNWSNGYNFENDVAGEAIPTELLITNFTWDGNNTHVSNFVNNGRFLVVHRDHGGRTGWGHPNFSNDNVIALSNGNKLPVVWSINCQTGWFDTESDNLSGTSGNCFAEEWITHNNGGAIGIIAATRVSYSGHNDRFTWGLMDAIWPGFIEFHSGSYGGTDGVYRMGDVINYAKDYYSTRYSGSYRNLTIEMFHYLGDPTMEIFTEYPSEFTNVSVSETSTSLTINTGVSDCRVCVSSMLDNGESYYEVQEGQNLTFTNITKPYCLTVSKHNFIPYFHNQDVYIQNHTFTESVMISGRNIYIGEDVTTSVPNGPVVIEEGVNVIFRPTQNIEFDGGFEVELGGTFEVQQ